MFHPSYSCFRPTCGENTILVTALPFQRWVVRHSIIRCGITLRFFSKRCNENDPILKIYADSIGWCTLLVFTDVQLEGEVFTPWPSPPGIHLRVRTTRIGFICRYYMEYNVRRVRNSKFALSFNLLARVYRWCRARWTFWPWVMTFYRYFTRTERGGGVARNFKPEGIES